MCENVCWKLNFFHTHPPGDVELLVSGDGHAEGRPEAEELLSIAQQLTKLSNLPQGGGAAALQEEDEIVKTMLDADPPVLEYLKTRSGGGGGGGAEERDGGVGPSGRRVTVRDLLAGYTDVDTAVGTGAYSGMVDSEQTVVSELVDVNTDGNLNTDEQKNVVAIQNEDGSVIYVCLPEADPTASDEELISYSVDHLIQSGQVLKSDEHAGVDGEVQENFVVIQQSENDVQEQEGMNDQEQGVNIAKGRDEQIEQTIEQQVMQMVEGESELGYVEAMNESSQLQDTGIVDSSEITPVTASNSEGMPDVPEHTYVSNDDNRTHVIMSEQSSEQLMATPLANATILGLDVVKPSENAATTSVLSDTDSPVSTVIAGRMETESRLLQELTAPTPLYIDSGVTLNRGLPRRVQQNAIGGKDEEHDGKNDADDCLDVEIVQSLGENEAVTMQGRFRYSYDQQEKLFTCLHCNTSVLNYKNLKNHLKRHMPRSTYQFPCELCDKRFCNKNELERHLKSHKNERNHICQICGKGFIQKSHLDTHVRSHEGIKPYQCEDCPASFVTSTQKKVHWQKRHGKGVECDVCQVKVANLADLNLHKAKHHTEGTSDDGSNANTNGREPKGVEDQTIHICVKCEQMFKSGAALLQHWVEHSLAEAASQCDVCQKVFKTRAELAQHRRQEHESGVHVCDDCGEGFLSFSALANHMKLAHKTDHGSEPQGIENE